MTVPVGSYRDAALQRVDCMSGVAGIRVRERLKVNPYSDSYRIICLRT